MIEEQQNQNYVPYSNLEADWLTTETGWGKDVSPELQKKLTRILKKSGIYQDYQDSSTEEQMWGLLSYYTRDIRLGNLSRINGEVKYVVHWINLAGDSLRAGLPKSFLSALTRAITIIEVSQSVGGFWRRMRGTSRYENITQQLEPKKRSVFGGKKNNGGEYQ